MSFEFFVTSEPPAPGTPFGGHRAGRNRTNPFDQPIKASHEQKLFERGEWLAFKGEPDDVQKHVNRIRAAGQYLRLGTEVRVDKESGLIAFRGVDYRPRATRANSQAGNGSTPAVTSDAPVPAVSGWAWDARPEPASAQ